MCVVVCVWLDCICVCCCQWSCFHVTNVIIVSLSFLLVHTLPICVMLHNGTHSGVWTVVLCVMGWMSPWRYYLCTQDVLIRCVKSRDCRTVSVTVYTHTHTHQLYVHTYSVSMAGTCVHVGGAVASATLSPFRGGPTLLAGVYWNWLFSATSCVSSICHWLCREERNLVSLTGL